MSGAETEDSQSQAQQTLPPPYMPPPPFMPTGINVPSQPAVVKEEEEETKPALNKPKQSPSYEVATVSAPLNSDFSYKGILSFADLASLRADFSDLVLCPALIGAFGYKKDPQGRISIPGALAGIRESKKRLLAWTAKTNGTQGKSKLEWWTRKLEERKMEPIKVIDILNGLPGERWAKYRELYRLCAGARSNEQCRARKRLQAMNEQIEEERLAGQEAQQMAAGEMSSKTLLGRHKPAKD